MKIEKAETAGKVIGKFVGKIAGLFVSAGLILWGWNVIAPHLNAPLFTYWEILAMRVALGSVVAMFKN
jgi:hypothetical protein